QGLLQVLIAIPWIAILAGEISFWPYGRFPNGANAGSRWPIDLLSWWIGKQMSGVWWRSAWDAVVRLLSCDCAFAVILPGRVSTNNPSPARLHKFRRRPSILPSHALASPHSRRSNRTH